MATSIANPVDPLSTRRWPRYHARLPVLIDRNNGDSKVAVPGLACEISQRGMALYGGVDLHPGDRMEVQFQDSGKRMAGVVRNRSGFCFGLEFVDLMTNSEAANVLQPAPAVRSAVPSRWKSWLATHRGDAAIALAALLFGLALSGVLSLPVQGDPANSSQPSLTLGERMLLSLGLAELPAAPITTPGNPNVNVWVDTHTGLYYCPGADLYGKTPDGKYANQRDAQMDQFEPAARKNCQ